jgi:hypothetical protein
VDIVVDVPGHHLIYVEMKVEAAEREHQLLDYRQHLDREAGFRKATLVFLTLDGRRSDDDVDHVPQSFRDLLRAWLSQTPARGPTATYLGAWLSTVARDLLRIADQGPFLEWPLARRAQTLDLVRSAWVANE